MNFPIKEALKLIKIALEEDLGSGDVSSLWTIPEVANSSAELRSKANGVLAGMEFVPLVCDQVDKGLQVDVLVNDGEYVEEGQVIAKIQGRSISILGAERTFLNFLQHLSGVASSTRQMVEAIDADSQTQILDTRKTLPGYRLLQKYAVKMGGGNNHRIGLYDMVMLKENHISAAGGITPALEKVFKVKPEQMKVEVELENLNQVEEALSYPIHQVMLDNMDCETMRQGVEKIRAINSEIMIEASGNMTLERIPEVSRTGVDYISIGALTHSVSAFDISLRFV